MHSSQFLAHHHILPFHSVVVESARNIFGRFEVFTEALDDEVGGGVEHEPQLAEGGDRQPKLSGERNQSITEIKQTFS